MAGGEQNWSAADKNFFAGIFKRKQVKGRGKKSERAKYVQMFTTQGEVQRFLSALLLWLFLGKLDDYNQTCPRQTVHTESLTKIWI